MKLLRRAKMILTGLALFVVGCDSAKETTHEEKLEPSATGIGTAATPGPIDPSPTPSLPFPGTPEAKALKDAKDEKKEEAKPADSKPAAPKT